jgi:oligoendopeptidase F
MEKHWRQWYADSLSEMDPLFWCTKLHFHLSGISFYNYPYIFGYLFALGVYAQKEKLGADFFPAYKRLLRDTGRMTAENVAMRHLGVDLTKPDFWRESLAIVGEKVASFEASVNLLLH